MLVKVNTDEMEQFTKKIDENSLNLYKEIMECLKDVEKINQAYQSIESNIIIENYKSYLEHLKTIPFTYNELNKITKKANRIYLEEDQEFLNIIQRESCDEDD